MTSASLVFHDTGFAYETATRPLLADLALGLGPGWTGVVGANGSGKTTLLRLAVGQLEPTAGAIETPGDARYCPQRTDDLPAELADLLQSPDPTACRLAGRLELGDDWTARWETLSHGERKRAQIAVALWRAPEVLAIDEPTNHLDRAGREVLAAALGSFRGIGLLVSHDRELLDQLCHQCLFVEPPRVRLFAGGYTQARLQAEQEDDHARRRYEQAGAERKRLEREAARRREAAYRADRKRSKRGIAKRDHDAKAKIDQARVTGKDAVAGKLLRQIDGRLEQAREAHARARIGKAHATGIWLPGSQARQRYVLHLPAGALALGEGAQLRFPSLAVARDDRIALTGPNGSGKSTLVRHILETLELPEERFAYVPQEIDLAATAEILDDARRLPKDALGHALTVVSRLNSRPERLLESREPSPGEVRKLLLATKIAREPYLIVMDEPTNHMDLPSIEALEAALDDCPCALLLVSHDERFLQSLTRLRWAIAPDDATPPDGAASRDFRLHEAR